MSYISSLIEEMEHIDKLTDEMLEMNLPWDEEESRLHGEMQDAIYAYSAFLEDYVRSRSERVRQVRKSPAKKTSSGNRRTHAKKSTTPKSKSSSANRKKAPAKRNPTASRRY